MTAGATAATAAGRPRGEARQALHDAAQRLATARLDDERALREALRGVTWRDMAQAARVGFGVAKVTVRDMARAGDLVRLPVDVRTPHSRRPMAQYLPSSLATPLRTTPAVQALDGVQRAWLHGGGERMR